VFQKYIKGGKLSTSLCLLNNITEM